MKLKSIGLFFIISTLIGCNKSQNTRDDTGDANQNTPSAIPLMPTQPSIPSTPLTSYGYYSDDKKLSSEFFFDSTNKDNDSFKLIPTIEGGKGGTLVFTEEVEKEHGETLKKFQLALDDNGNIVSHFTDPNNKPNFTNKVFYLSVVNKNDYSSEHTSVTISYTTDQTLDMRDGINPDFLPFLDTIYKNKTHLTLGKFYTQSKHPIQIISLDITADDEAFFDLDNLRKNADFCVNSINNDPKKATCDIEVKLIDKRDTNSRHGDYTKNLEAKTLTLTLKTKDKFIKDPKIVTSTHTIVGRLPFYQCLAAQQILDTQIATEKTMPYAYLPYLKKYWDFYSPHYTGPNITDDWSHLFDKELGGALRLVYFQGQDNLNYGGRAGVFACNYNALSSPFAPRYLVSSAQATKVYTFDGGRVTHSHHDCFDEDLNPPISGQDTPNYSSCYWQMINSYEPIYNTLEGKQYPPK